MKNYEPFDGNQSVTIGELKIENSEDKVVLYGDFEITRDKEGLENLEKLLFLLEETRNKLKKENLPDKIQIKKSVVVNNPFKK